MFGFLVAFKWLSFIKGNIIDSSFFFQYNSSIKEGGALHGGIYRATH